MLNLFVVMNHKINIVFLLFTVVGSVQCRKYVKTDLALSLPNAKAKCVYEGP